MKRLLYLLTGLALLVLIALPTPAYAASRDIKCDPILSGLWAGVNFIFSKDICVARDNDGRMQLQEPRSTTPTPSSSPVGPPRAGSQPNQQPTEPNGSGLYVALGDSVAAGLGLPVSQPDQRNNRVCGVSDQSYVQEVAARTGLQPINLACSGATAGDMFTEQHLSGTSRDIEPQLDRAFEQGDPELITITAGANDVRWVDFLQKCYATTCGTNFDNTTSNALLSAYTLKLRYALHQIDRQTQATPQVIMTGYYLPVALRCADASEQITRQEVRWFNQRVRMLNTAIEEVASRYSFVTFAPVNFNGHRLCTDEPWIQGVGDPAPFHPNSLGQSKIAESIVSLINE